MQPTNELRFVEREIVIKPMTVDDPTYTTKVVYILQQKWKKVRFRGEVDEFNDYEWLDVPVEKE